MVKSTTSVKELALIVGDSLEMAGVKAVLTGGSVVSIYTKNQYESYDLDFVLEAGSKYVDEAMKNIGFSKEKGGDYSHPNTLYKVEFLPPPLAVGNKPIDKVDEMQGVLGSVKILTPTQSAMDRLAGYYHWDDEQSLDQAVMIAKSHKLDIEIIEKWSGAELMTEKFLIFKKLIDDA